jgi:hypothetical protein
LLDRKLIDYLGLGVPAVVQLGELLAESGLTEPGEVASLEQLLEVLTVLERKKDNEEK